MAKAENKREKSRTSFIIYNDTQHKLRYVALMEGKNLTDILDEALVNIISQYEKKNGPIPVK